MALGKLLMALGKLLVALAEFLILRSAQRGRLEGRTALIQGRCSLDPI